MDSVVKKLKNRIIIIKVIQLAQLGVHFGV